MSKVQPDRATAIRAAVDQARTMSSSVPADYADKAIASGKSPDAVKAELFDLTTGSDRARSKANMRAIVAGMAGGGAEPATAGAAASRASMHAELKRQGLTPRAA